MITLEYLAEQKTKYQDRMNYFKKIGFDNLSSEFQAVIDLIGQMEEYLKESEHGED